MEIKRYLKEIVLYFLLPLLVIGVVIEYSIRKIPNDYAYKNEWLSSNSKDVKVIALGASSILYNINPEYFHEKGFNAAHFSQSFKYDNLIFNKFIDEMPKLEYVLLGVDFWSPFGSMENGPEWWRIKYYNIHYGTNIYKWQGKYNYEIYLLNTNTLKIASGGLLTLLGIKKDTHRTVNDFGHGSNYTLKNRMEDWDNGIIEAVRHNELISATMNEGMIEENKRYVEDIINKCAERDIKVILVSSPLYKSYFENQDSDFLNQYNDFCRYFVESYPNNVVQYNFSNDSRFTEDDFYDSNHLNEVGSAKLTMILDSVMFK